MKQALGGRTGGPWHPAARQPADSVASQHTGCRQASARVWAERGRVGVGVALQSGRWGRTSQGGSPQWPPWSAEPRAVGAAGTQRPKPEAQPLPRGSVTCAIVGEVPPSRLVSRGSCATVARAPGYRGRWCVGRWAEPWPRRRMGQWAAGGQPAACVPQPQATTQGPVASTPLCCEQWPPWVASVATP